jgi:hypothetical protein
MMHSHMRVRISRKSERVNAPAMTEKETNQKNLRAFLVYFACKVVGASKAGFLAACMHFDFELEKEHG